ncbi:nif-specific transcriptional activator NifA [Bradyrhizobium sp. CB3481]|uniref:nif-specific transcriptional activator NifA n=1 Tax=Bradyrhizobium sp. CB3481 TaxID=3039158 RepID=UPI0024B0FAAE|nr:nif-specific transcriptional activator NifA [Bradyrhizobium sp. CB3481]WFU14489.1 nif-specific transcriptional activator NifA [Bradyrhizobium sp. CB3481]
MPVQHNTRNFEQGDRVDGHTNGDVLTLDINTARTPNLRSQTEVTAVASQENARAGIFDRSKVLAGPCRIEVTLANVVEIVKPFVPARRYTILLFGNDGGPDLTVGAGLSDGSDERYRKRLPQKAIDQIVATERELVAENVRAHSAFSAIDLDALGAPDNIPLSFIGVPIRIEAKVAGTLTIDRFLDDKSRVRLDSDARLLTVIAHLVGQTVKLHRLFASDRERLMAEKDRLQKQSSELKQSSEFKPPAGKCKKGHAKGIVGDSPALRALLEKAAVVAKSSSTVLIRGESGTGKELVAQAIHEQSARAKRPFIKLNCAALPETVLESELFGHDKGAFTGAVNSRKGRFELADTGTLFLDEIGEISASFQAKLLRVLQEQEFERVGSNQTIKVDVRVIAATNKNLEDAVTRNEFRADLYYRISVVPLVLPPLRERRTDIPLLAAEFLRRFNSENGRALSFDASATALLMRCGFPGNVRELENCVQRSATLAPGPLIVRDDFACSQDQCLSAKLWKRASDEMAQHPRPPTPVPENVPALPDEPAPPPAGAVSRADGEQAPLAPADTRLVRGANMIDRESLIAAMQRAGWVQAKAARLLKVTPRQVGYALGKYGVEIKKF